MQSSRVLFFVVRQIAELITVVKIQTVQTAFLSYAMFPCCKTVLTELISLLLIRLQVNLITVFLDTFLNAVVGVILTEPIKTDSFLPTFRHDRPILQAFAELVLVSHLVKHILKLFHSSALADSIINSRACSVVSVRHTRFSQLIVIRVRPTSHGVRIIVQLILLTEFVCDMPELEPRLFFIG